WRRLAAGVPGGGCGGLSAGADRRKPMLEKGSRVRAPAHLIRRSHSAMAIAAADKGLVTVFGGSGFLGRHVVRALLKRGWRVRAAVRRPDLAGHLQPLGKVGWVQPVQANLRHRWSVDRAVTDADVVINLVAILNESGR